MSIAFESLDLRRFWRDSDYARQAYIGAPPTPEVVQRVEQVLGYRLPRAYIALMQIQNGGIPVRCCHRVHEPTSWAADHIALAGLFAIGSSPSHSLCGDFGSRFWIDSWDYPPIGIYFADCPSAGHDMLCLDYRGCGPQGEPAVVHVDQELDFRITHVAPDFESFIRGLEDEEAFGR